MARIKPPWERAQITCVKCRKLVDRVEVRSPIDSDAYIMSAFCHGDMDQCVIPGVLMFQLKTSGQFAQLMVGEAFGPEKLEIGQRAIMPPEEI